MEQVASRARVSKGLIYNYFPSKKRLLEAVLRRGIDDVREGVRIPPGGIDSPDAMAEFINHMFALVRKRATVLRLYVSIMTEPIVMRRFKNLLVDVEDETDHFLARGLRLCGWADPEGEAQLFHAMLDGVLLHYLLGGGRYPLEAVRARIIERYARRKEKTA